MLTDIRILVFAALAVASSIVTATTHGGLALLTTQHQNTGNVFTSVPSFLCGGIACDDFESGGWSGGDGWLWGWWQEGDSAVTTDGTPYEGSYHLRLRTADAYVDRALDLSGQSNVHLQFWAKVDSFEAGDYIECAVVYDATWNVVGTWTDADSDSTYHFVDVDLSPYTMSSEFYVAFDSEMFGSGASFYVDDMLIKAVPP